MRPLMIGAALMWRRTMRRRPVVEEDFPQAQRITLVLDNLSTHTGASLYKTFAPEKARALLQAGVRYAETRQLAEPR